MGEARLRSRTSHLQPGSLTASRFFFIDLGVVLFKLFKLLGRKILSLIGVFGNLSGIAATPEAQAKQQGQDARQTDQHGNLDFHGKRWHRILEVFGADNLTVVDDRQATEDAGIDGEGDESDRAIAQAGIEPTGV